ncbi:MAG: FecR domain-containing protein [Burkholderiales bacterium]|nr:FecR domain-containing protein [Burkholderiales bacterium]
MYTSIQKGAKSGFVAALSIILCFIALSATPSYAQFLKGVPGSVTIKAGEITYYPSENTTLSDIALQFTNDINNWRAIAKHNKIANDRTISIGASIVIPTELLPEEPSQATVVALAGEVIEIKKNGTESALATGNILLEASQIRTGKNGFVSLSLPDNSRISIPSNSLVALAKLRKSKFTLSPRTEIRLINGKVESKVSPLSNSKGRFEVTSPLAIAGVRGTHFRVGVNPESVGNEVLEGGVAVGEAARFDAATALILPAGKGNVITPFGVGAPIDLLPKPELEAGFQLQERPVLQFIFKPVANAAQYRAQISLDQAAQNIVAEGFAKDLHSKFDGIPDGNYFVRVTAIDANQLEGLPATFAFTQKANPVPPFTLGPKNKVRAEAVEFSWAEQNEAKSYHLQVASDAKFSKVVLDQADLTATSFNTSQLAYGSYFWRIATVADRKGKPDHGPFSDAQSFVSMAPQTMNSFADSGSDELEFSWPGEPGQTFQVQIASDAGFAKPMLNKSVTQAKLTVPRPEAGEYFIRVRATDADGFVGTFSKPQKFEIFMRWVSGNGEPVQSSSGVIKPNSKNP